MYYKIKTEELAKKLRMHEAYLADGGCGKKLRLEGADMSYGCMQGLRIPAVYLENCKLCHANFEKTSMKGSTLLYSDLSHANLKHTELGGACLVGCNLKGTSLLDCNMYATNLLDAEIDHNIMNAGTLRYAKVRPESLPWLMLHPNFSDWQHTLHIIKK